MLASGKFVHKSFGDPLSRIGLSHRETVGIGATLDEIHGYPPRQKNCLKNFRICLSELLFCAVATVVVSFNNQGMGKQVMDSLFSFREQNRQCPQT